MGGGSFCRRFEGVGGGREAGERQRLNPRADLANAGPRGRHAGIDDGREAMLANLEHVDARRHALKSERRNAEERVFAQSVRAHAARACRQLVHRAADEFGDSPEANAAELLIMPGATQTLKWVPDRVGVVPFYCTDFCSALHQEMQGYLRVSPASSNVPLTFSLGQTGPK